MARRWFPRLSVHIQQESFHPGSGFCRRAPLICRLIQPPPRCLHRDNWHRDGRPLPAIRLPSPNPRSVGQSPCRVRGYAMLDLLLLVVGTSPFDSAESTSHRSPGRILFGMRGFGVHVQYLRLDCGRDETRKRRHHDGRVFGCCNHVFRPHLGYGRCFLQGLAQVEDDPIRQVPQFGLTYASLDCFPAILSISTSLLIVVPSVSPYDALLFFFSPHL